jgi:nicotinamidase-related amidase
MRSLEPVSGDEDLVELRLRHTCLRQDSAGHAMWVQDTTPERVSAGEVAILICDMWDAHWSRGASERVDAMAPQVNHVVAAARRRGVHIIHAPSETLDAYSDTPARLRAQRAPEVAIPQETDHQDPPLPIDDSDGGSDTGEVTFGHPWRRQHPAIGIDHTVDALTDDGREVYRLLALWGITRVLILGVHTNMCILNRSFGIKQMVRWGVSIALVRDLTDAMYNPARPPYVSHEAGTQLVIGYIERFWCPTVVSTDLLRQPVSP